MDLTKYHNRATINVLLLCGHNYNAWQAGLKIKEERPVFQIILIKFIVFKKTACHTTPFVVYILAMIRSWANSRSRRFYEQGKTSKLGGMDTDAAEDLLAILDAAESLKDISPLKSVGLHKLSGDRAGQWAMTINGPWRICFRFKDGDAFDVEITDYHKG